MGNCCCITDDALVYNKTINTTIETDPTTIEEVVECRKSIYPSESFVCSVCMDETDKTEIESTPCGHVFHRRCLRSWWNHRYTCPFCGLYIKELLAIQKKKELFLISKLS